LHNLGKSLYHSIEAVESGFNPNLGKISIRGEK